MAEQFKYHESFHQCKNAIFLSPKKMPFFPTFKQAVAVKSTGEVLGLEGSELYDRLVVKCHGQHAFRNVFGKLVHDQCRLH